MKNKLYVLFIIIGYLSILINSLEYLLIDKPYLLILSFFILFYVIIKEKKSKELLIINLLPFSSGILSFIMRLFYIDKFDYADRLNNLILLSLVFTIIGIIIRYKLYEKFLKKFNLYSIKKRVIIIFVITEIIFILSSFVLVKKGVILLGDEPHYLAISHSIAKDYDINVFNQYARDEYRDFIDYRLKSHAKEGKGFKKWYSIHLPGVSFTLAPFLLFKIPFTLLYFLIRSFMGLFGAGIAVLIYLFSIKLLKRVNLSIFITIVFTFTAPIFFMSIHIFAEIQSLFLLLLSLYLLVFENPDKKNNLRLILSGLFMSLTVFWGLKYLLFIVFYLAGNTIYLFLKKKYINIVYISIFPIISIIIFTMFLYYAYGTISPTAIYTGVISIEQKAELIKNTKAIPFSLRVETLLDYFFDQRDGLLLYNPFYLFFFPGLILSIKNFKKYYLYILISIPGFVYILYHGYSTIRAGYCPQARYLTPVMWVLLIFTIIYYIETQNKFFQRLFYLFPVYSLFTVIYQLLNPFTLYQQTTHDSVVRGGLMFQKLSNLYINITEFLPSFAKIKGNFEYIPNIVLFVFLIAFIFFAIKKITIINSKLFHVSIFIIILVLVSLFPQIPLYNPINVKDKINKNLIPFTFYSNREPSGRIYSEGFGSINGNGRYKLYLSVPKYFLIKNRIKNGKNISAKISFFNFNKNIMVDIFNYNIKKLKTIIQKTNNSIIIKDLIIKDLKSQKIIVFTIDVKNNSNKKPLDFRLKLFYLDDKLS